MDTAAHRSRPLGVRKRLWFAAFVSLCLSVYVLMRPRLSLVTDLRSSSSAACEHNPHGAASEQAQLQRLRDDLDEEATRRLHPSEWRALTYIHQYWSDIGFGARPNAGPPVAVQLGLHASVPPPAPTCTFAQPEGAGPFYQPSTWFERAGALRAPELNATLVASQSDKRLMLAADVWFVDGCVRLISTPECSWLLDWRNMTIAVHGAWKRSACSEHVDGSLRCPDEARSLRSDSPLPPSRVRTRTLNEWSVTVELCSAHLLVEDVVDVEFYGWGVSKRWLLPRVDAGRRPHEELAMAVQFKNSTTMLPLWLQYWRTLGVGRFYLYVSGRVSDLADEDTRIASQLAADPGVTLIQWDLPFLQINGLEIAAGKCSGHYSQIMAFNHAYERIRRRHLYMGFYDPDEFGLLNVSLLQAAWKDGANPMLRLLGSYGFPPALAISNRFSAIVEAPYGVTLSPTTALHRGWFGRDEVEPERSKSWVRTMGMREDINIGNHNVFEMVERGEHPRTGTVFLSGSGYEMLRLRIGTYALPQDATMMHVINFKEHVSKLPFDRDAEIAKMVAGRQLLAAAAATLGRSKAVCQKCASAATPGCTYDC